MVFEAFFMQRLVMYKNLLSFKSGNRGQTVTWALETIKNDMLKNKKLRLILRFISHAKVYFIQSIYHC